MRVTAHHPKIQSYYNVVGCNRNGAYAHLLLYAEIPKLMYYDHENLDL